MKMKFWVQVWVEFSKELRVRKMFSAMMVRIEVYSFLLRTSNYRAKDLGKPRKIIQLVPPRLAEGGHNFQFFSQKFKHRCNFVRGSNENEA